MKRGTLHREADDGRRDALQVVEIHDARLQPGRADLEEGALRTEEGLVEADVQPSIRPRDHPVDADERRDTVVRAVIRRIDERSTLCAPEPRVLELPSCLCRARLGEQGGCTGNREDTEESHIRKPREGKCVHSARNCGLMPWDEDLAPGVTNQRRTLADGTAGA